MFKTIDGSIFDLNDIAWIEPTSCYEDAIDNKEELYNDDITTVATVYVSHKMCDDSYETQNFDLTYRDYEAISFLLNTVTNSTEHLCPKSNESPINIQSL